MRTLSHLIKDIVFLIYDPLLLSDRRESINEDYSSVMRNKFKSRGLTSLLLSLELRYYLNQHSGAPLLNCDSSLIDKVIRFKDHGLDFSLVMNIQQGIQFFSCNRNIRGFQLYSYDNAIKHHNNHSNSNNNSSNTNNNNNHNNNSNNNEINNDNDKNYRK